MSTDTPTPELCAGSGRPPAEMVILDTDFCEPPGTCQVCHKSLRLRMYRLPDHAGEAPGG